jgi:TolA-binding protein
MIAIIGALALSTAMVVSSEPRAAQSKVEAENDKLAATVQTLMGLLEAADLLIESQKRALIDSQGSIEELDLLRERWKELYFKQEKINKDLREIIDQQNVAILTYRSQVDEAKAEVEKAKGSVGKAWVDFDSAGVMIAPAFNFNGSLQSLQVLFPIDLRFALGVTSGLSPGILIREDGRPGILIGLEVKVRNPEVK